MASSAPKVSEYLFQWEGRDRNGKRVSGELRALGEGQASSQLRRMGISPTRMRKQRIGRGRAIRPKDIALFTRQMATMMKAGVPLLQAFDIVGRGHVNPRMNRLLADLRADVETGSSLSQAFRKYPQHFDALYCNLVQAGETAGILDSLLDRLATHMEKIEAVKSKIRSAMTYPVAVLAVAFIVVAVIMLFVIPAFKQVFASFGADLPAPTLFVIGMSELFARFWWLIFGALIVGLWLLVRAWSTSAALRASTDRLLLRVPLFGDLVMKSAVARWTRTLSTMLAAGVPLVEVLDSVGGAAGNVVYAEATRRIQQEVATGTSLGSAMAGTSLFPMMVQQMTAIGEESGSLDHLLGKAADFYEQEVDDMVSGLSRLMEPVIIVVLGGLIGGIVVSMYLPIFKIGSVV